MDVLDVLCPATSTMYATEQDLIPHIVNAGSAEIDKQIAQCNRQLNAPIIAVDEQHSRSQRAGKRAPYCSAVFVSEDSGKIVHLSHASKQEAIALEVKDLAKAARVNGLKTIGRRLQKLDMVVVDGCAAAEKDLNEHIRSIARHAKVRFNKDLWHKAKSIGKKWKILLDKRASRGVFKYPKLQLVGLRKVKTHWTYCARNCQNDKDKFYSLWIGALEHWSSKYNIIKDSEEYTALKDFLEYWQGDIQHYVHAKYTSNTESFHHVANKYCSKGLWRSFPMYKAKKTLAMLE